ncbi:MAG: energy transducer TonB [Bacteroidota bacterium]
MNSKVFSSFIYLCLAFWVLLSTAFAQDTLYLDEYKREIPYSPEVKYYGFFGEEDGKWMFRNYYVSNDQLYSEGAYKSSERKEYIGEWKYYHENGNTRKFFSDYKDGFAEGPYLEWFANGQQRYKGAYKEGSYHGKWEEWYESGIKRGEFDYVEKDRWPLAENLWLADGSQAIKEGEGEYIKYWPGDTSIQVQGKVQDKLRTGDWKAFYEDGSVLEEVQFEEGFANGNLTYYWENGEVEFSGKIKNNASYGDWKLYKASGKLEQRIDLGAASSKPKEHWHFPGNRIPIPLNLPEIKSKVGYPKEALELGVQGQLVVRILLDENGQYVRHFFLRQIHPSLSEEVEKHIVDLKFTRGYQESEAVKFWINIPFSFRLID